MTRLIAALATAALIAGGCGSSSENSGDKPGGTVEVTMWHGQNDIAGKVLGQLADEFNRTHKGIKVKATTGGVVADQMRQKVTTALASGEYPDIAYIFGSDLANLARSDKVMDLTDKVNAPGFGWDDYYQPARDATMVNGRVRALPALVDDLAVVYNKKAFAAAGVDEPPDGWTWDDFAATSKALTNRDKGTFGTAWPAVGDEDTVWRTWPLVWQGGGEIITDDGKAGFGGAPGEQAFGVVDRLAQDGSVYVDTKPDSDQTYQLFNNGKIGMVVTGPWQLPDFIDAKMDFGVAPLPTFGGEKLTISAPDTWTIFDNGDARSKAAVEFVQWLNSPAQDAKWVTQAGSLPLRKGTAEQPEWAAYQKKVPGLSVFLAGLDGARVKPANPAYPKVSEAVGQSLVAVLLKRAQPADALQQAVQASDAVLAGGG
jgi:multiple sugar transport system substrate-binding protein